MIVATRPAMLKVRDVYRMRVGGIAEAARAHRAFAELVDAGWLIDAAMREGTGFGRHQDLYAVNNALWPTMAAEGR